MELTGYIEECSAFASEWNDAGKDFVVAHTSGSTGTPKEIRLSKNDMATSARATNRFFGIDSGSLLHLPLSPSYIAGKMMIVRASVAGCELLAEKPSSSPLADYAGRDITLSAVVPSQIPGLLNGKGWRKIDNLIIGGAPLSAATERKLQELGVPAYATYGMTETCSHVALRKLGSELFRALPDISFSLDERGCLAIDAPQFSFKRVVTNDLAELDGAGAFRWLGRYDNVINSGGIKIIPEAIEERIAPLMGDAPFYISSRESERWGTEAVMIVEGETSPVSLAQLKDLLGVICPKEIICEPKFDRTSSSKIIRNKY